MKAEITITETDDVFSPDAKEKGFYLSIADNKIYFIDSSNCPWFVCEGSDIETYKEESKEDEEPKENMLSESFALKMLAVASGKVDNVKL